MKEGSMATTTAKTLTNLDRCDRCGAQAYVRFEFDQGMELMFCNHHATEHGDKIRAIARGVQDESHRLIETKE
jgi:hypothetical protein